MLDRQLPWKLTIMYISECENASLTVSGRVMVCEEQVAHRKNLHLTTNHIVLSKQKLKKVGNNGSEWT